MIEVYQYKKRWGYKGSKSALNGISLKLQEMDVVKFRKGYTQEEYYGSLNGVMVDFLRKHGLSFRETGSLQDRANTNAQVVQKDWGRFISYIKAKNKSHHG